MNEKQVLCPRVAKAEVAAYDADEVEEHQAVEAQRLLADLDPVLLARTATSEDHLDPLARRDPPLSQEAFLFGSDQVDTEAPRRLKTEERAR